MLEQAAHQGWTQRALAGTTVVCRFGYLDSDGVRVSATAEPTVAAVDLAGDTVDISSATTVSGGGDNADLYEATIAAADSLVPDQITVTWTVDGVDHVRTLDVVGGYLVSLYDARTRKGNRNYQQRSDDELKIARTIVEDEAEEVMGRSMVPRARKAIMRTPGALTRPLILPDIDIMSLRSVTTTTPAGADTAYTAAQLTNLHVDRGGFVHRLDGSAWPSTGLVTVIYTYGLTHPPHTIVQAALRRLDYWMTEGVSNMPEFSTGYTVPETGMTFRFGGPQSSVGDMVVDRAYGRMAFHDPAIA